MDSKILYDEKILPDVKKIGKELSAGKDSTFFDICGEE
jgi:hypothetical protein